MRCFEKQGFHSLVIKASFSATSLHLGQALRLLQDGSKIAQSNFIVIYWRDDFATGIFDTTEVFSQP